MNQTSPDAGSGIASTSQPAAAPSDPAPAAPAKKAKPKTSAAKPKPAPKTKKAKKPAKAAKAVKSAKAKKPKDPTAKSTDALAVRGKEYVRDNEKKTAGGNVSVHCGDEVAQKLLGKSLDDCYKIVAKAAEETEADLRKKYKHLNLGMQRMNLGNKLRGVLNAK